MPARQILHFVKLRVPLLQASLALMLVIETVEFRRVLQVFDGLRVVSLVLEHQSLEVVCTSNMVVHA